MMTRYYRSSFAFAAAVLTAGALGACKTKSEYGSNDSAAAARLDSAGGRTDSLAGGADSLAGRVDSMATMGKWSDAAVLSYTTAVSTGEIAVGKLAESKATNRAVKDFARLLVRDHQQMLSSTKQLDTKLSTTVDTMSGDARDLLNHTNDELKDLGDKAKGADWDEDFIDKMIGDHQQVLDKLQDAAKHNTNASLRSALEQATGKVQEHLTRAQDIKAKALKS